MKEHIDRQQSDRQFSVGDFIYVKLQPYYQMTVARRDYLKLSTRIFRPFQVVEKVDEVAYKLVLPLGAKIHLVFHVS